MGAVNLVSWARLIGFKSPMNEPKKAYGDRGPNKAAKIQYGMKKGHIWPTPSTRPSYPHETFKSVMICPQRLAHSPISQTPNPKPQNLNTYKDKQGNAH